MRTSLPAPVKWGLMLQASALAVLYFGLFLYDANWGHSAFFGGLIYFLPNIYFTLYAFRYQGPAYKELIVRSFYWGQSSKLMLVAMGFALVFRFYPAANTTAVFCAFFAMIVSQWLIARQVSAYQHEVSQNLEVKSDNDKIEKNI